MASYKLILLRHGESLWNKENRFTGWMDVDLSEKGVKEAQTAGRLLRESGLVINSAFTSVLKRAIRTLWITLDELDRMWIPVERSWRLNERHYGSLQGLNKSETVAEFGKDQVFIWRRSFDTPPPPLRHEDPNHPSHDPKYTTLSIEEIPSSEALKQTQDRVLPYWDSHIAHTLKTGQTVLVAAHGNSLRALVKYLDHISDDEIASLNIPTGIPLVYELDEDLKPLSRQYLGDPEAAAQAAQAVANQTGSP